MGNKQKPQPQPVAPDIKHEHIPRDEGLGFVYSSEEDGQDQLAQHRQAFGESESEYGDESQQSVQNNQPVQSAQFQSHPNRRQQSNDLERDRDIDLSLSSDSQMQAINDQLNHPLNRDREVNSIAQRLIQSEQNVAGLQQNKNSNNLPRYQEGQSASVILSQLMQEENSVIDSRKKRRIELLKQRQRGLERDAIMVQQTDSEVAEEFRIKRREEQEKLLAKIQAREEEEKAKRREERQKINLRPRTNVKHKLIRQLENIVNSPESVKKQPSESLKQSTPEQTVRWGHELKILNASKEGDENFIKVRGDLTQLEQEVNKLELARVKSENTLGPITPSRNIANKYHATQQQSIESEYHDITAQLLDRENQLKNQHNQRIEQFQNLATQQREQIIKLSSALKVEQQKKRHKIRSRKPVSHTIPYNRPAKSKEPTYQSLDTEERQIKFQSSNKVFSSQSEPFLSINGTGISLLNKRTEFRATKQRVFNNFTLHPNNIIQKN